MFLANSTVFCFTVIKDYVFFLIDQFQGILSWNFKENTYNIVTIFPKELRESGKPPFGKIIGIKDELYLLPDDAEDIYVYNLEEKKFKRLYISLKNNVWGTRGKYLHGIVCDENLYCISITNPTYIIEIDMWTKKYSVYYLDDTVYTKNWEMEKNVYPIDCLAVMQQDIVLPYMEKRILKFNMKSKTFCSLEIDNLSGESADDYILGICGTDWNSYWVYSAHGKIYKIDGHAVQEWKNPCMPGFFGKMRYGDENELKGFGIGYLILVSTEIYFISWSDYRILKYDINFDEFEWISNPYVKEQTMEIDITYEKAKKLNKNQILLYCYCEHVFYLFDIEKNIFKRSVIQLSNDEVKKNKEGFIFKNEFLADDLELLFDYIKVNDEFIK